MIKPDPVGAFDLIVGVMMLYTTSPVPVTMAEFHAYFLIIKGGGTMLKPVIFPYPVFVLGAAADLLSAAIIHVGTLPILTNYAHIIATILFLKGLLSLFAFM